MKNIIIKIAFPFICIVYYIYCGIAPNFVLILLDLIGIFFLSICWIELCNALQEAKYLNAPTESSRRRKRRWYYYIALPRELLTTIIFLCYTFFLFNWRASSLFILGIAGYLFKRVIEDPIFILQALFLYRGEKNGDNNKELANIYFRSFPHAIYIPHLGYSKEEIDDAIAILIRSYLSNSHDHSLLIYHSDHRDPELISWTIKRIKQLCKKTGIKNYLIFCRNQEKKERDFLGKPGAYLADYQFILTGIRHPLIYTEKGWDARAQVIFLLDEHNNIIKEITHHPFIPPELIEDDEERYFIYYYSKEGLHYLRELAYIELADGSSYQVKLKSYLWLINQDNPELRYRIYMGAIYDKQGKILAYPSQWRITPQGEIKCSNNKIVRGNYFYWWQKELWIGNNKYIVDQDLNIRDAENRKLYLEAKDYKFCYRYQLFHRKEQSLILIKEDFIPQEENFIGHDLRRNPLQAMHMVSDDVIKKLKYKNYTKKEIDTLRNYGIFGNIEKLNIGKLGWEICYAIAKSKLLKELPSKIEHSLNQILILNSKDGFFLDSKNNLYYYKPVLQGKKSLHIASLGEKVNKVEIYIDPATKYLIKRRLLADIGEWYKHDGNYYLRSLLAPKELISDFDDHYLYYFDVKTAKKKKIPLEEVSLSYNGILNKTISFPLKVQNIVEAEKKLWQEEILAKPYEYKIEEDGIVLPDGKKLKLGLFLEFKKQLLPVARVPLIINQSDADGELPKGSLALINSFLLHQYYQKGEYGMLQPEISFSNVGESLFIRLLSWAHEAFKFVERGYFQTIREAVSYGKVAKFLPWYMDNVGYREVIPAIARTHDHWEAMYLPTWRLNIREKALIEKAPSNFYSYFKRRQGWLKGDLILLELESYFGVIVSLLRCLRSLLWHGYEIARYWYCVALKRLNFVKLNKAYATALGRERVRTLRRTTFSTTYFLLWLTLSGVFPLIIPGTLTVKSPLLGWLLFGSMMLLIIFIPKFIFPLLSQYKHYWLSHLDRLYLLLSFSASYPITVYLIKKYPFLLSVFLIIGYGLIILKGLFLPLSFVIIGKKRPLKARINGILAFAFLLLILLVFYDFMMILAKNTISYWIPFFLLQIMPFVFGYLLVVWFFLIPTKVGRAFMRCLKESLKELLLSTSTLLLLLIYEPLHIFSTIFHFIKKPFTKVRWLPQSYYEYQGKLINSPLKAYRQFWLPPLFSLLFIIIPVYFNLIHPAVLTLGWPIFILSWLLGPLWVFWTGAHRKSLYFNRAYFCLIRKFAIKEMMKNNLFLLREWIENNEFSLSDDEKVKLIVYLETERIYRSLKEEDKKRVEEKYKFYIAKFNIDPRVRDWDSLPELKRIEFLLHCSGISKSELQFLKFLKFLLFEILKKGWAEKEWQEMRQDEKKKVFNKIVDKLGIEGNNVEVLRGILSFAT